MRGWSLEVEKSKYRGITEQENKRALRIIVVGALSSGTTAVHAILRKEIWLDKILKYATRELQAGDKLFDDAVFIDTDSKEAARPFLENSSVQSAILELLNIDKFWAEVRIDGNQVRAVVESDMHESTQAVQLQVCLLLHHLEKLTERVESGPYR